MKRRFKAKKAVEAVAPAKKQPRKTKNLRLQTLDDLERAVASAPIQPSAESLSEASTLSTALSLMSEATAPQTSTVIKRKELGLGLTLAGLAELQAHRVMRLHTTLSFVEDRLFTPEILGGLTGTDLVDLYKLMSSNIEASGKFIAGISKSLNWEALRESLQDVEALRVGAITVDDRNQHDLQVAAGDLLQALYDERRSIVLKEGDYQEKLQ